MSYETVFFYKILVEIPFSLSDVERVYSRYKQNAQVHISYFFDLFYNIDNDANRIFEFRVLVKWPNVHSSLFTSVKKLKSCNDFPYFFILFTIHLYAFYYNKKVFPNDTTLTSIQPEPVLNYVNAMTTIQFRWVRLLILEPFSELIRKLHGYLYRYLPSRKICSHQ